MERINMRVEPITYEEVSDAGVNDIVLDDQ